MKYLAKRQDTGELVEFQEDPARAPGYGEVFHLPLGGQAVACKRVILAPQVLASDRRKRLDEGYREVRSDGRLSSMQYPTRQQAQSLGLPSADYYDRNGHASFMTREAAKDYGKALTDKSEHTEWSFNE